MDSPAAITISNKSMKRFSPGSSSSWMDPDVVEITQPVNWSSNSKSGSKRNKIAYQEVISIDSDDDSDVVLLNDDKEVGSIFKRKQSANVSLNNMPTAKATNLAQYPINSVGVGFSDHDFVYDDAYMNLFQDVSPLDSEYALQQTHFDNIGISTGTAAPVPWFQDPIENKEIVGSASSSYYSIPKVQLDSKGVGSSHSWRGNGIAPCSSGLQAEVAAKQLYFPGSSFFPAVPELSQFNNKLDTPTISGNMDLKMSTGTSSLSSRLPIYPPGFSMWENKYDFSASSGDYPAHNNLGLVEPPSRWDSYGRWPNPYNSQNMVLGKDTLTSNSLGLGTPKLPPSHSVGNALNSMGMASLSYQPPISVDPFFKVPAGNLYASPQGKLGINPASVWTVPPETMSSTKDFGNLDDIMKIFQAFKQFDTVEDYSDHHFAKSGSSVTQQPKKWAKAIQREWKILEKDLPDTIFVRAYESRMDLLRAVIVGPQGTPYRDGLFFFDIFFPSSYPSVPPQVHYHSGGLRINPNLYNTGYVCLSLLNTWSGRGKEKWIPNVSTMLQVLVSIQALVLNEEPYYNEPGHSRNKRARLRAQVSENYNERTFVSSLKTMVYSMRRPPKHFEEFVIGYFCEHAQDILGACKLYIEEGVQVGSITEGKKQSVCAADAGKKQSVCAAAVGKKQSVSVAAARKKQSVSAAAAWNSSQTQFVNDVAGHITMLVEAFEKIGAKDCDKYLSLAQKAGPSLNSFNQGGVHGMIHTSNVIPHPLNMGVPGHPMYKSNY